MKRRVFIKAGLLALVGAGLLRPLAALAAWNKGAFQAETLEAAIGELIGTNTLIPSDRVRLILPPLSQNGVVVPVTVETSLAPVGRIILLVEKNPNPFAAEFALADNLVAEVTTRIKMNASSRVVAIVESAGSFYSAETRVEVERGGCYLG